MNWKTNGSQPWNDVVQVLLSAAHGLAQPVLIAAVWSIILPGTAMAGFGRAVHGGRMRAESRLEE